jgi:hypothetical protein
MATPSTGSERESVAEVWILIYSLERIVVIGVLKRLEGFVIYAPVLKGTICSPKC